MAKSKWVHVDDGLWTRFLNNGGHLMVWGSNVHSPSCSWTISVMDAAGVATEIWPGYKTSRGAKSVATLIAKDYGFLIE